MNNQKTLILEYMRKYGSISSYEAFAHLGITQLGARIDNLQDDGYVFKKRMGKKQKRWPSKRLC